MIRVDGSTPAVAAAAGLVGTFPDTWLNFIDKVGVGVTIAVISALVHVLAKRFLGGKNRLD